MTAIGAMGILAFAAPATAQNYDWGGQHYGQHERLDDRHDDVHDELDTEHDAAHEEGLSRWEHRQLHRDLRFQHEEADYRIARQHQRQHRRNAWQRRAYGNYGYRQPYGY
jgi:hypothetical protein